MEVKAKCRNCGREAPADSFVLDPSYGYMVCQDCVKHKQDPEQTVRVAPRPVTNKPVDWDREDEMIERAYEKKMKEKMERWATTEPIDDIFVRYTCQRCKHEFRYNTQKEYPKNCPFCGTKVLL